MNQCEAIREAIYSGMLGLEELFKFYNLASEADIKRFEDLLERKAFPEAIDLLGKALRMSKGDLNKMKKELIPKKELRERLQRIKSLLRGD